MIGEQGVFFGSRIIELKLPEPIPSLEIRYTTDGSEPTAESPLYEARSIDLDRHATGSDVRQYCQPTIRPSNVATATFIAIDPALESVSSNLPLMVLDTLGQVLPKSDSTSLVAMNVALFDTSKVDGRAQLGSDLVDYLGRGGARRRGSSTDDATKTNMAFETWGDEGTMKDDDDPASLLGMAADADWILHGPGEYDRARIRNQLAFDLSNRMDMWASDYRHIEVYLNDGDGVVDAVTTWVSTYLRRRLKRAAIESISPTSSQKTMPNPRSPVAISGRSIERIRVTPPSSLAAESPDFGRKRSIGFTRRAPAARPLVKTKKRPPNKRLGW